MCVCARFYAVLCCPCVCVFRVWPERLLHPGTSRQQYWQRHRKQVCWQRQQQQQQNGCSGSRDMPAAAGRMQLYRQAVALCLAASAAQMSALRLCHTEAVYHSSHTCKARVLLLSGAATNQPQFTQSPAVALTSLPLTLFHPTHPPMSVGLPADRQAWADCRGEEGLTQQGSHPAQL